MKFFRYLLQLVQLEVRHLRTIVLLGALLVSFSTTSFAQWTTNGNNINNTNSGNVGVGTASPSSRLTIVGPVQNGVYTVQIDSTAGGQAGSQHGILLLGTLADKLSHGRRTTINGYLLISRNINGSDNTNFSYYLGKYWWFWQGVTVEKQFKHNDTDPAGRR